MVNCNVIGLQLQSFNLAKELLQKSLDNYNNDKRKKICIVGNGWSSYYLSKNLDKKKYFVQIIAPNEKILNTPKLIKSINEDIDVELENKTTPIINDLVLDINEKTNKIVTEKFIIDYDYIVFCIGSEYNDFNIEGVNKYAFKIKNKDDINVLKEKLNNLDGKEICIIGSGPTGIELASKLKNMNYNVNIIEGLDNILPGFNNITKNEIKNYLNDNKINLNLKNFVKKIDSQKIYTNEKEFKYDLVIWTGGIKFNGFKKTKLYNSINNIKEIQPRGINVNNDFTINNNKNIFCLGDMVANKGPPTAQNAKYQSIWLAEYFNNNLDTKWKEENEFENKELGKILHLDDKLYMESYFYSGYLNKFCDYIIDYIIF